MPLKHTSLAIVAFSALLAGCATNPVTGERQLALVSEPQELEMGKQAAEETRKGIGVVKDDGLQAYVQSVGTKLAAHSERPQLPWSFQVVDDPTPERICAARRVHLRYARVDGLHEFGSGTSRRTGHEIGHVTARHSVQQISRAQIAQLGLGLGMILAPDLQQFGNLLGSGMQPSSSSTAATPSGRRTSLDSATHCTTNMMCVKWTMYSSRCKASRRSKSRVPYRHGPPPIRTRASAYKPCDRASRNCHQAVSQVRALARQNSSTRFRDSRLVKTQGKDIFRKIDSCIPISSSNLHSLKAGRRRTCRRR